MRFKKKLILFFYYVVGKKTMDSINNICRSFNVMKEMLNDQGHDLTNLESITKHELEVIYRQNENIFQIDVNPYMKIIYYMNAKFKIQDLRKYIQPTDNKDITDIILVFKDKINNFNAKNIDEFNNINLQVFLIKELLFNISKHSLVPKHEVIKDNDEITALIQKYNLKSKLQFPIILKSDPMARYFNVRSGQLVKVTRNSPSSCESILYRCCV
jgi:DNA-directed RNA polymerase I, II, and III subunit RPABC1